LCLQVRFSEDLGEVYKLRIGFADDNAEEQNWLLDTVSCYFLAFEKAKFPKTQVFLLVG